MLMRTPRIILNVHFEIPFFADSGGRLNQFVQDLQLFQPLLPDEENSSNVPNFVAPFPLLTHGFCFFLKPIIFLPVVKTPPMGLENLRIFLAFALNTPRLRSALPTHCIRLEGQFLRDRWPRFSLLWTASLAYKSVRVNSLSLISPEIG
ncbi:hypothetical protein NPIL_138681 [Nephila pilipes]|uniref:Uncharacterized protein n=1 Tax=Nephila pilipes TaxID=299642 RepID=A0A8X6U3A8_NEPPI|nr:hypothetical protein NPIL_138681 [Nephila pilipes]